MQLPRRIISSLTKIGKRGPEPEVMDSDSDNRDSRKWPQVVRPLPRPLFSLNKNNIRGASGASVSTDESASPHPRSRMPSTSTQLTGDSPPPSASRGVSLTGAVITESPISSPTLSDGQRSSSSTPSPSTSRGALTRSRAVKKSSLLSNVSSPDSVAVDEPSQSRRRWDELRRHFLPTQSPAQAAQVQPSTTPPTSSASDVPQRPSTPKQFRMPKLGFRQVVEQAQESVVDQNKRFADDVHAVLRALRPIDPKASRREREGTLATVATSFNMNMGLMGSSASLGMASISSSSYATQSRGKAARRPPSLFSEASQSPLAAATSLYSVISYHASNSSNGLHFAKFLPHESEVLSALLAPFTGPRSEAADYERLRAMDAFEVTVRTWGATSKEVSPFISVRWCHL